MNLRLVSVGLLCSVLNLMLMANMVIAAPAKSINIKPTRPDPVYERRKLLDGFKAAMSQLNSGGDAQCYVNEPISLFERNRLRKSSTTYISITDGADVFLFDDQSIFRNLEVASLSSDRNNGTHLKSLTINYPDIKYIGIYQASPLSSDTTKSLIKFEKLTDLCLSCPINSPEALFDSLPKSLRFLQIYDNLKLPSLPHLSELRINTCRIDSQFFAQLDPTSLELMYLDDVDLSPGTFKHLGRFKSLREILVNNSNIDDSDVQTVRELGYVSLRSYGSEKHRLICWNRAEKLFKDKNFKSASDNYKWSVFGAPSVYGYLQLARCQMELGDIPSASKYRDHAASIDPTSKEVAEFDAHIENRRRSN